MMQLLEHFKELTLHPKNAEELKGLISQLAVQGKLTRKWREENPDVESASVLLENIKVEKERLVKAGKIKKEKPIPAIENAEFPFELPISWNWCMLGDLNQEIHYGYTASALQTFNGIRMLRITDIQDNKVNWDRVPDCDIKEKDFQKYKLEENDILIARTGGTIGKSYQVKGVSVNSVFASYLIRAIPMKQVYPEYIKLFLGSPYYWKQLIENSQGTGQPNVNATALKGLSVSLAPLEEQKAIVETVNQLFAEVEQLEALTKERIQLKADFVTSALNQLTQAAEQDTARQWEFLKSQFGTFFTEKENIKKLRESILQLAVQGKLTHHWRTEQAALGIEFEPASILLEKIKAEKAELIKVGKIKREKPLPEISEEEVPYELPEGWVWCRIGEAFQIVRGSSPRPKGDSRYWSGSRTNYHWITIADFTPFSEDGFLKNTKEFLTELGKDYSREVTQLDLLIACSGVGSVGRSIKTKINGYIYDGIIAIRQLKNETIRDFVSFFIQMRESSIYNETAGGGWLNINTDLVKNYVIGFPPLDEQKAIVEKVNGLMALCDRLEQEIDNHQNTQEQWMQSCLREVV